jgi:hypothetical protein
MALSFWRFSLLLFGALCNYSFQGARLVVAITKLSSCQPPEFYGSCMCGVNLHRKLILPNATNVDKPRAVRILYKEANLVASIVSCNGLAPDKFCCSHSLIDTRGVSGFRVLP